MPRECICGNGPMLYHHTKAGVRVYFCQRRNCPGESWELVE